MGFFDILDVGGTAIRSLTGSDIALKISDPARLRDKLSREVDRFTGGGDDGGGAQASAQAPGSTTNMERDINNEILIALRKANAERPLTEEEQLLRELSIKSLEGAIADQPEQQAFLKQQRDLLLQQMGREEQLAPLQQQLQQAQLSTALGATAAQGELARIDVENARRNQQMQDLQIQFAKEQLINISEAKKLGEITGDLSREELGLFDDLATSAINRLTEEINEDRFETMQTEIASLVDRGVLQSDIGATAISKIDERALELISRGTADIESNKIANILARQQQNKQFELSERQTMLGAQAQRTSAALSALGLGQQGLSGAPFGVQVSQPQSQFTNIAAGFTGQDQIGQAIQSQQFATGLDVQRQASALGGSLDFSQLLAGKSGAAADRALQQSLTNQQAAAAAKASKQQAIGTGVGAAAGIVAAAI